MTQLPPVQPRPNRRRREPLIPSWAVGALVGLFLLSALLAGYLVFTAVRDFVAGWQITSSGQPSFTNGDPGSNGPGNGGVQPTAAPLIPHQWTGTDRVTILLLGIDRRAGETDRAYRTDSIMILSVDPVAKTGVMLSVPRDLWVEIPGYDTNTINTANFTGDAVDYPGGGPALAMKTVEHNLGIEVDYYVRMDFTAFETLIDTIGGIEVDNPEAIDDPYYPDGSFGYEPFYLPAGRQHLNGHDALRYARTRHDSSDINRAERQQQVVLAVRDKVLSPDMLPQLILKAPPLYQTLNESVQTDLTLDEIVSLALLAQDIPHENLTRAVIDYRYVLDYTVPGDPPRQVLVPLRDQIRELMRELFTPPAALASPLQIDPAALRAEGASVEVLNGAGVPGLAGSTAEWLTAQGVNVVATGNADRSDYTGTVIVDYTGNPRTTQWLQRVFNVDNAVNGADPNSAIDVRIILGQDWQLPSSSTP